LELPGSKGEAVGAASCRDRGGTPLPVRLQAGATREVQVLSQGMLAPGSRR
jgi:hypothetical protein